MTRKVCHILGTAALEGTGIAKIVSGLHKYIDHEKYELAACFVGEAGPWVEKLSCQEIPTEVVKWKHPSRDVVGALRLLRYLRSQDFDIIHFHWGGPKLRRLVRGLTRSAVILHLHSEIEEGTSKRGLIPTSGCDLVIAVSKSVANASRHSRTRVIYPGVEAPTANWRTPQQDTIGFAGRLVALKGLPHLFDAVHLLKPAMPQLQLRIAGTGPELEALKARVESLGLQDNVTFLGWVNELAQERKLWTVMAQPSLDEGAPLSVLEAMAEGVPVIASRAGGLPDLIEDGATGCLVEPGDVQALANALREVLENVQTQKKIGEAAAMNVRKTFSVKQMADSVSAVYDELLLS
jgi:glycosyltransferase involved in cell wall biosynthesis